MRRTLVTLTTVAPVGLDIRQLECFIAVAEEANFGRAAARLHMTQPPLTRRIKRLEADVGAALFVRTPRGVEITAPGTALLEQARRIVALSDVALQATAAAHAGEAGQLLVGYFGSPIFGDVPSLLAEFCAEHPGIEVRIERIPKTEQPDAVRDGRVHVGFSRVYPPTSDLVIRDIAFEALFAAVSTEHALAGRTALMLADLADEPMVLFPRARPSFADSVMQICAAAGFGPRVHSEAEDVITGLANVAVGAGVAIVPASAANINLPGLAFIPVTDAPPQALTCIYRAGDHPPVLAKLLTFISVWRPHGGSAPQGSREAATAVRDRHWPPAQRRSSLARGC